MIGMIVLIALILVINHVSPRLGEAAAWMIVVGFLLPLFTFGGGTLLWVLVNLMTGGSYLAPSAWWWTCAGFGLPLGCIVSWFVLRKEK